MLVVRMLHHKGKDYENRNEKKWYKGFSHLPLYLGQALDTTRKKQ